MCNSKTSPALEMESTSISSARAESIEFPKRKRGKQVDLVKILTVVFIPISLLLIQTTLQLIAMTTEQRKLVMIEEQIEICSVSDDLISAVQIERTMTIVYLHANETGIFTDLEAVYNHTDSILKSVSLDIFTTMTISKETCKNLLSAHRNHTSGGAYAQDAIGFYSNLIDTLLSGITVSINKNNYDSMWKTLFVYDMLIRAEENYSSVFGFGMECSSLGGFRHSDDYVNALENLAMADNHLEIVFRNAPQLRMRWEELLLVNGGVDTAMKTMLRQVVHGNETTTIRNEWYRNFTTFIDILHSLRDDIIKTNIEKYNNDVKRVRETIAIDLVIVITVVVILPIIILTVRKMTSSLQYYAHNLEWKTYELYNEKQKTNSMMYQTLPRSVAQQLRMSKFVLAESYDAVTIYFSDVVGFNRLAAKSSPTESVNFLNAMYKFLRPADRAVRYVQCRNDRGRVYACQWFTRTKWASTCRGSCLGVS
ncbi:uncharacterized protein LOC100375767 [Saccoglossus kowalevskii]|uniref:Uncharacterized protein LOC100375767 n=1 Tax=Saccoglossus kowalevskii TaxID=10224 RepID=A0ABM0MA04_SACKO|nr:PREDICTED: uncharacterized protein LOC100375767 [Saccoglossus kowalevskii]